MSKPPTCAVCRTTRFRPDAFLVCLRPDPKAEDGTREEWLCGRPKCATKYNEEDDVKVIEVVDGIPIVKKEKDPGLLRVGELLRGEGREVWEVTGVRPTGADVKCVMGRSCGRTAVWSSSSAGARHVSREEFETARRADAEARAKAKDETPCVNCWPNLSEESDKADYGRDPNCADHVVSEEVIKKAAAPRKRSAEEAPEDVAKVVALRKAGKAYHEIEKEMGWPDTKGGRPYRIVKAEAPELMTRGKGKK